MSVPFAELAGVWARAEVGVDRSARGRASGVLWGVASVIVIEGNVGSPVVFVCGSERPLGVIIRLGLGTKALAGSR